MSVDKPRPLGSRTALRKQNGFQFRNLLGLRRAKKIVVELATNLVLSAYYPLSTRSCYSEPAE